MSDTAIPGEKILISTESGTTVSVLHVLRNPFGWSEDTIRRARLVAADLIERAGQRSAALPDNVRFMLLHSGRSTFLLTIDNVNPDGSMSCHIVPTPRATGYEKSLALTIPPAEAGRYEPPTDEQVQTIIDAAKATGMPTTALRWALQRLDESPEQRHARGCFNDEPGTTMCEVCGGDLEINQ